MPGPAPKNPAQRRRRNKASTAAKLKAVPKSKTPPLPELGEDGWHKQTVEFWDDIHRSPMSAEWDESDIHGLYMLALLVDQFWKTGDAKLAGEIRLQRQCFGLTSLDRRRLQWEIDRGDAADEKTKKRATARKAAGKRKDPRLEVV
jgi:hypothetical protein